MLLSIELTVEHSTGSHNMFECYKFYSILAHIICGCILQNVIGKYIFVKKYCFSKYKI